MPNPEQVLLPCQHAHLASVWPKTHALCAPNAGIMCELVSRLDGFCGWDVQLLRVCNDLATQRSLPPLVRERATTLTAAAVRGHMCCRGGCFSCLTSIRPHALRHKSSAQPLRAVELSPLHR